MQCQLANSRDIVRDNLARQNGGTNMMSHVGDSISIFAGSTLTLFCSKYRFFGFQLQRYLALRVRKSEEIERRSIRIEIDE